MRLSNNLIFKNNINKILENQQGVATAQQRVNTGQKYLTISESPAAASQALLFSDQIVANEQFTKNITQLSSRLATEESVLQSINANIQHAQTLVHQAGNGAYSDDDLNSVASELAEIQKTILSLMNSRSEDGKFIFSGYQDSQQPYTFNKATDSYEYQGDQGNHEVIIAKGIKVKSSDNGIDAFEQAAARLNVTSNTGIASGNITSGTVYVDEQAIFDQFHTNTFNADPNAPAGANTFNVVVTAGTPDQYEIQRNGVALTPAVTGDVVDDEVEFAGLKITLDGTAPGQLDFTLEKPHKENVLNTLQGVINGLRNTTQSDDDFQQVLSDGLVQLQNSSEKVVFTQAGLGARMNTLDRIADSNSALDIQNKKSKANLVEIDMAQAISDLTKQETALQVSQATFGRLSNLSLFDYI